MSLPLSVMNLVVSSLWALYGYLLWDAFIIMPNSVGAALAIAQVALIQTYPGASSHVLAPIETETERRGPSSMEYKV